ncbi:MAG: hypothetical protein WD225_06825 [Ilumatobacteraceae bacterium]
MRADAGPPARSAITIARSVADSAMSHQDVTGLDGGLAGEFATYGLGGRVVGVRVDLGRDGRAHIRVRLVVRFGASIPAVGDEVRSRVLAGLREFDVDGSVHVHVADITDVAQSGDPRSLDSGTA